MYLLMTGWGNDYDAHAYIHTSAHTAALLESTSICVTMQQLLLHHWHSSTCHIHSSAHTLRPYAGFSCVHDSGAGCCGPVSASACAGQTAASDRAAQAMKTR